MANKRAPGSGSRSVRAHDVRASVINLGDGGTIVVQQSTTQTEPLAADVRCDLADIMSALRKLETADRKKIDRALMDVEEELEKPEPSKQQVADPMKRALEYAKSASGFAAVLQVIRPKLDALVRWLGDEGRLLLGALGL